MKVAQFLSALDNLAPQHLAEKWDNVGLLLGDPQWESNGVVIAGDLTLSVFQRAKDLGYRLILNHHPCIFPSHRGINRLVVGSENDLSTLMANCLSEKIAVIACHTNFDRAAKEVNTQIADSLGIAIEGRLFENLSDLRRFPGPDSAGYGFYGALPQKLSFSELAPRVKKLFNIDRYLMTGSADSVISKVAFTPGKGSAFIGTALELGCDLYLTGEVDYHEATRGSRSGMVVMELGHQESEKFFLKTAESWVQKLGLASDVLDTKSQWMKE